MMQGTTSLKFTYLVSCGSWCNLHDQKQLDVDSSVNLIIIRFSTQLWHASQRDLPCVASKIRFGLSKRSVRVHVSREDRNKACLPATCHPFAVSPRIPN